MQFVKKENRTDASYLRGHERFEMLSYATKWIKTHNQLRSQIEVCEQKTYIHTQCRSAEIFFFFFPQPAFDSWLCERGGQVRQKQK